MKTEITLKSTTHNSKSELIINKHREFDNEIVLTIRSSTGETDIFVDLGYLKLAINKLAYEDNRKVIMIDKQNFRFHNDENIIKV